MTQTLGEFRVGITFNVGGSPQVDKIKRAAANFIDLCEELKTEVERREHLDRGEVIRLFALAETHMEDAAMWAVKAVTKPPRDD